jgi:hypothetical protein
VYQRYDDRKMNWSLLLGVFAFVVAVEHGSPALADPASTPGTVTCAGVFGRESSYSDMVSLFGAANVVLEGIEGTEGIEIPGTVIYPNDPLRRLEVLWIDAEMHRHPGAIWISNESHWKGWRGVRIGMTLEDVETLNGKPFKLRTFVGDCGGEVTDWRGGAMAHIPGGCRVSLRFEPAKDTSPDTYAALEAPQVLSSNPKMKATHSTVRQIYTTYAK